MSAFSWRLACVLAFVHLTVTLSVWFAAFANVFGRKFGEFAALMKHRPPPPHEPTTAEALLHVLVQPLAYVLQELQIKPLPAYLAIEVAARAAAIDPDRPPHLTKVTETL